MWYDNTYMPHYLKNNDLVAEILACQPSNKIPNRLALMLQNFVQHYAQRGNWRQYSYRNEMEADAPLQLIKPNNDGEDPRPTILKFDISYAARRAALLGTEERPPNAFAYVTQCVKNSFIRRVKLEHRETIIRDDLLVSASQTPSMRRQMEDEDARSSEPIVKPEKKPPQRRLTPRIRSKTRGRPQLQTFTLSKSASLSRKGPGPS